MRNDRYLEILRHSDSFTHEDAQVFHEVLRLISFDREIREFFKEYANDNKTMKDIAKDLGITLKEAKRRRQVLFDTLDTVSEMLLLEKVEEVSMPTQSAMFEEVGDMDLAIIQLKKNIDKIDLRKRETRHRKKKTPDNNALRFF
jgi:hypothetical protein